MGSGIQLPALHLNAPPQQPSPLEQYGQLLQLKNEMQNGPLRQQLLRQQVANEQTQGQVQQAALQEHQQGLQDQAAFRTAMQAPEMQGRTIGEVADALAQKGAISQTAWTSAKKADTEQQKAVAELTKDKLSNSKESLAQIGQLYGNVMNLPDDQLAQQWPNIAQQYDTLIKGQTGFPPLDPNKPLPKQALSQFGPMISLHNTYLDQEVARRQKEEDLKQSQGKSDPNSPFYAPSASSVALGTAPMAAQIQANEVRQAARKAGAEESAKMPGEMALAAQKQALSQGDPNAAGQLLVNGDATLSELKSRGATPDFIARSLFAAKKQSNGQYNAQAADANYSVAKSPANVAFFGSAKSLTDKGGTLDQLAEAAKGIPGGQIPVFNSIADWEKAATGSGPIAKYASIALGVADDYSKVMGGGQGSDSSRAQALNLISAKQSPEQRAASIEGVRGAVSSQLNSRIGKNPVLRRMYGEGDATPAGGNAAPGKIRAIDPQGVLHEAPAGTPLPAGWRIQ